MRMGEASKEAWSPEEDRATKKICIKPFRSWPSRARLQYDYRCIFGAYYFLNRGVVLNGELGGDRSEDFVLPSAGALNIGSPCP